MTKDEAMKQALEALEKVSTRTVIMGSTGDYREGQLDALSAVSNDVATAITALREALAKQPAQQEPVAYWIPKAKQFCIAGPSGRPFAKAWEPLYTFPPAQRTWVGLTDEEITDIWAEASPYYHEDDFARAIEAKLKEKNT